MGLRSRMALILTLAALSIPVRPALAATSVSISGFAFQPASVTVLLGTSAATMTWTNNDGVFHTVTDDAAEPAFDSGPIASSNTYTFAFTSTGSFGYHCAIHAAMTGIVTVVAGSGPDLVVGPLKISDKDETSKTVEATVTNGGTAPSGRSTLVVSYTYHGNEYRLLPSGVVVDNIGPLAVGASETRTFLWRVLGKVGTFHLTALADSENKVAEAVETNNTAEADVNLVVGGDPVDAVSTTAAPADAQAFAVGASYVAGDDAPALPEIRVAVGHKLFFTNLDPTSAHSLVSKLYDADGVATFDSPPPGVTFRNKVEIRRVPTLAVGSYFFFCSLHPDMQGTLIVEPAIGG